MARRDPLRKLSKLFPAPPELTAILDAIREQEDRSAAIMATAILESVLEKVLVKRLRSTDPNLIGQLFNNRGPLSDFHSKILIAVGFGIISQNMSEEMHRIKAIRNVFAHATTAVSFHTKEIADEVSGFIMLATIKNAQIGKEHKVEYTHKGAFLLIVRILCIMLDGDHRELGAGQLLAD